MIGGRGQPTAPTNALPSSEFDADTDSADIEVSPVQAWWTEREELSSTFLLLRRSNSTEHRLTSVTPNSIEITATMKLQDEEIRKLAEKICVPAQMLSHFFPPVSKKLFIQLTHTILPEPKQLYRDDHLSLYSFSIRDVNNTIL